METAELVRERLDSGFTPEQALLALRADRRPFALAGRWAGGGAIVGSEPTEVAPPGADPFATLTRRPEVAAAAAGAVGGGWFGYLGYQLGDLVERLSPPPPRPIPIGRSSLAFHDHVLRLDADGRWWFEALVAAGSEERINERLALLRDRLAGEPPPATPFSCGEFRGGSLTDGYRRAVEACLGYIAEGDLYQANLAIRLEAEFSGAGIDLFAAASATLRPAYGAYLSTGDAEIVSLSPELFLRRIRRRVLSAPIKGTSRRSAEAAEAKEEAHALGESAKDRAENVMIVDLIRNDLGRVCEYGSIEARLAKRPEAHPGLWHLVSEVEGVLRSGVTDSDLLRATFPPGSVTGAPKIMAEEVISTLEGTAREAYTGAVGFSSPLAGLELNVAIRTFEISRGRIWLGAGAGIVADSDPAAELDEVFVKAEPLVAAAGSVIADLAATRGPARRAGPTDHRRGPQPMRLPRPDPSLGILETLLVVDGRPAELEGHLNRLRRSSEALYGRAPGRTDIELAIRRSAPGSGRARARVSLVPDEAGGLELTVAATEVPSGARWGAVALAAVTVPGGLGPHKWADRRLVDSVAAERGREALILDLDGSILETGAGNVWLVEGGTLLTPPADGRILPGVTRSAVLETAAAVGVPVAEAEMGLDRLRAAEEILITSSVRGLRPAILAAPEGVAPVGADSDLSVAARSIMAALEERWSPGGPRRSPFDLGRIG